jgi:hypothetical protein
MSASCGWAAGDALSVAADVAATSGVWVGATVAVAGSVIVGGSAAGSAGLEPQAIRLMLRISNKITLAKSLHLGMRSTPINYLLCKLRRTHKLSLTAEPNPHLPGFSIVPHIVWNGAHGY